MESEICTFWGCSLKKNTKQSQVVEYLFKTGKEMRTNICSLGNSGPFLWVTLESLSAMIIWIGFLISTWFSLFIYSTTPRNSQHSQDPMNQRVLMMLNYHLLPRESTIWSVECLYTYLFPKCWPWRVRLGKVTLHDFVQMLWN